ARMQDPHDILQYPLRKIKYYFLFWMLKIGNPSTSFFLPNRIQPTRLLTESCITPPPPRYCLKMDGTYVSCIHCRKKVVGDDGDIWCSKCEIKVEKPIS
ncbi:hypothetical protein MKW98_004112, partial [Papaver atlanticum]